MILLCPDFHFLLLASIVISKENYNTNYMFLFGFIKMDLLQMFLFGQRTASNYTTAELPFGARQLNYSDFVYSDKRLSNT